MSDAPQSEPVPPAEGESAPASQPEAALEDEGEPLPKKRKVSDADASKLEHRLGGILCCAVCLDLPPAAVYQCTNGHLMCAPCFSHLLADARLRDESATCPNCRVEISKTTASRNLAVEKTVSELPSDCKFCARVFPRHALAHHQDQLCDERGYKFSQIVVSAGGAGEPYLASLVRMVSALAALLGWVLRRSYLVRAARRPRRYLRLTGCRFAVIGCPWRGPAHEARGHEAACAHPAKSAADVLAALGEREQRAAHTARLYSHLLDLLSYEKITFNDLQLKPYRTEEFVHKLYYESSRFSAFGHQWVVKAFINNLQRDPTQSTTREITYQLILKSKPAAGLALQWVALRGPHGEAALSARVCSHAYREEALDAPPAPLPLLDPADTNRLLANKAIYFRLVMFQSSKS